jgi:rubredoxin
MPWRCPACRTEIQHNPADARPRTNEAYRCHVCRLELVFDEGSSKMVVAPFETDYQIEPTPQPRTIPAPPIGPTKGRSRT